MNNWKTSALGIGAILAGVGGIIKSIPAGDINSIAASVTGILSGIGLLFAGDASK